MKKSAGSVTKKLKSGASGHTKVMCAVHVTACPITLLQSVEATVVFKSYDKSSGVSLRSSKVLQLLSSLCLFVLSPSPQR